MFFIVLLGLTTEDPVSILLINFSDVFTGYYEVLVKLSNRLHRTSAPAP